MGIKDRGRVLPASDMTSGPLAKRLLFFALPIAASSILQQLFNSADVAVAGRFAAPGAIAAVGSNSVIVGLFVNLFVGLSVGANVVVSQYIGQKRGHEATAAVHTAVTFSVICGLVMMCIALALSRFMLELIDTPEDVLERAVAYLRIYCLGIPFIVPYNFCAAALRAMGDAKRPMYCLIVSGLLNIVLNLFFVIVCGLDVAGVAIATVISNVVSTTMVVVILCREKGDVRLELRRLRIEKEPLRHILYIGMPAAVSSVVFSISNICLQSAINGFGSAAVGGMTAAINFENFCYFVVNAFAQSAVTFTGHNYGAGEYGRCRKIMRLCMVEGMLGTEALSLIFVLFSSTLIRIFTVVPEEIEYAMIRVDYILPFMFLECTYEITGSSLRGMGRSTMPALFTVIGTVVFRLIWVYLLFPGTENLVMLLIVYPISWALTGGLTLVYYFVVRRKVLPRGSN